jgi:hypothetical protein
MKSIRFRGSGIKLRTILYAAVLGHDLKLLKALDRRFLRADAVDR